MAVTSVNFRLLRGMSKNRLNNGAIQVREFADPVWAMEATYAAMARREFQALEAWLDSLRGGMRTFLGYDPLKPYPVTYKGFAGLSRAGGGTFDGTAFVVAIGTDTLTISTLPGLFTLRAGDMIGLVEGPKRGLYRVTEDIAADGSGVMTVSVEPRIIAGRFTGSAVAHLERPSCVMVLEHDTISAARSVPGHSPISFSAIEAIT